MSDEESEQEQSIYDNYVQRFPEEYRETATSIFKEWDSNTTKKFEEIRGEYKPYQELVEAYEADALRAGISVLEALRDNPKGVYDQIGSHYGYSNSDSGNNLNNPLEVNVKNKSDKPSSGPDEAVLQKLAEYEIQLQAMQEALQQREQQENEAVELERFKKHLGELATKYGEYDEEWVLSKIAAGTNPEDAVKGYHAFLEKVTGKKPNGPPNVMGSGGGFPYQQADLRKLNSRDTQDLIAKYLERANQAEA